VKRVAGSLATREVRTYDVRAEDYDAIAVAAEHRLVHAVPWLTSAAVHTDPHSHEGADHHAALAHHRPQARTGSSGVAEENRY